MEEQAQLITDYHYMGHLDLTGLFYSLLLLIVIRKNTPDFHMYSLEMKCSLLLETSTSQDLFSNYKM